MNPQYESGNTGSYMNTLAVLMSTLVSAADGPVDKKFPGGMRNPSIGGTLSFNLPFH